MRELKFRVWDGKQFLRSYADRGEEFEFPHGYGKIVGVSWFIQCQRLESSQRFWVQQFTGLKDKNGREVYEGDIMENENFIGVVTFESGNFFIGERKSKRSIISKSLNRFSDRIMGAIYWDKIIGNTFENPELLVH